VNIAVCVKQTPDTEARIKLTDDQKRVDESDIKFILNPYDELAVEQAIRLKEANGGEVTVISLGPDRVTTAMRTALAMGADKAIHLKTDRHPDDPLVTAKALAEVLKEGNYDLIFLGKQAIDDDHNQMPSILGSLLDLPAATVVIKMEVNGEKVTVEREIEGGHEILEFTMPAVIGAQRGLNEPRYPALKGIMRAKKIKIEEREVTLAPEQLNVESYMYPPPKNPGKIVGDSADAVPELLRLLHEEAKVI
jgi:electron transfer flavoprotein beta subunit